MTEPAATQASTSTPAEGAAPPPSPSPSPEGSAVVPRRRVSSRGEVADILAELGVDPSSPVLDAEGGGPQTDDASAEPEEPEAAAPTPAATSVAAPATEPSDPNAPPSDPDLANRMIAQRWAEASRRDRLARERERRSLEMVRKAERFQAAQQRALEDPTSALEALSVDPNVFQERLLQQRLQLPQDPPDPVQEALAIAKAAQAKLEQYEQQRADEQRRSQEEHQRHTEIAQGAQFADTKIAPQITADAAEALLAQFGGDARTAARHVLTELVTYHAKTGVLLQPQQAIEMLDKHYEQQQALYLDRFRGTRRHASRFAPPPAVAPAKKPVPPPLTNGAGAVAAPAPAPRAAPAPRRSVRARGQAAVLEILEELGVHPDSAID